MTADLPPLASARGEASGRASAAGRIARTLRSSPPLCVLLRAAAMGAAALAVAGLHAAHDPGVLCPLRRLTGVPCPACGSTTVFIELGSGHWSAAPAANPVTVIAALGLLIAPLGPGRWWWRTPVRGRTALLSAAAAAAWTWQLHRLGISRS
jgi:hypothetical protein